MRVTLYLICAQKHVCCLPKHLLEPAAKHCSVRTCLSTIAWSRIILKIVSGLIWYKVWMFYLRGTQFLWFCALALHFKAIYNLRINEMPWMAQGFLAVCISTSPKRNKLLQTFFFVQHYICDLMLGDVLHFYMAPLAWTILLQNSRHCYFSWHIYNLQKYYSESFSLNRTNFPRAGTCSIWDKTRRWVNV